MTRFAFVVAACAAVIAFVPPAGSADHFISPDDITPGMAGYGLTVFEGTEPDTFAVESVGVMKNRMPKQDLVLIVMKDPRLIESNVVAGMSGSPIYFNGKLLGALAYGPVFSKKPVAYVTPIQNMIQELDRPTEPSRPWQTVMSVSDVLSPASQPAANVTAGDIVPVAMTLAVSGFSDERMKMLRRLFSSRGFVPVAAGSGDDRSTDGPTAFHAGSAIGVQLMSGDLGMTAVGTVTHIAPGGRVLAFGHPFFNIGQTSLPATTARVHMFMPSYYISYKLSSPIRTLGSMVQDRRSAIVIDPNRASPMTPVTVAVENAATGRRETFRYRVIREKSLTPMLTFVGLTESLDAAEAGPMGDRTFEVKSRIVLQGRPEPVELSDLSTSPLKTFFDVLLFLENPIVAVVPESIEFEVRVKNTTPLARITGAKTARRKFKPGEFVPVEVRLKTKDDRALTIKTGVTLPEYFPGRGANLEIRGGAGFSRPEAVPQTLDQVVDLMQRRPHGNDLIVRVMHAPPSIAVEGRVLPDLPAFFQKLALVGVESAPQVMIQTPEESKPTDWLILGVERLQIEIETE